MLSLYIHIPFCVKKCPYCDFYSTETDGNAIPQEAYFSALAAELLQKLDKYDLLHKKLGSIYFGGGTPSLLDAAHYEAFLKQVGRLFSLPDDIEITIEVNPITNSAGPMRALKSAGINRISIGAQSFNDRLLKKIGRLHSAGLALETVRSVKQAGFENISLDLMWGLPSETRPEIEKDLNMAVDTGCDHISAYQLTLENPAELPGEDEAREMWLLVHARLVSTGFEHYEISNFAKAPTVARLARSFRSSHNINYWRYGSWLGLGPSAVSFVTNSSRETCSKDLKSYLFKNFSYETEIVSEKEMMTEFVFMGLRMLEGIDFKIFEARFGTSFENEFPGIINRWTNRGLAKQSGNRLALTIEGLLISNELFQEL